MRARLTVIGFNIAVVSFQLDRLSIMPGGVDIPGFQNPFHAGSNVSLLLAIPVSMAAIVGYIFSSEYDEIGTCTSWSIVAADILMYLGLALTIAGFFSPIGVALNVVEANASANDQVSHLIFVTKSLIFTGGISWFLAAYVGPVRALWKSPFPRLTNFCLALAYLIVFGYLGFISASANAVDTNSVTAITLTQWLMEFAQPFRW
jgi:hypothetical protein